MNVNDEEFWRKTEQTLLKMLKKSPKTVPKLKIIGSIFMQDDSIFFF